MLLHFQAHFVSLILDFDLKSPSPQSLLKHDRYRGLQPVFVSVMAIEATLRARNSFYLYISNKNLRLKRVLRSSFPQTLSHDNGFLIPHVVI